ncbi:MAG: DUF2478 domain-containing protein [Myxococcales bacterium]|nr:DUF2478 domain-containing protein [Myxococcales bacterium]
MLSATSRIPWAALVGRREQGRSTITEQVIARLRGKGLRVGGFVQRPVGGGPDAPDAYEAVQLGGEARVIVASHRGEPEICDWAFDAEAFRRCRSWVLAAADVVVMELGPLEASGKGHWPAVLELLEAAGGGRKVALLTLRPQIVARVGLELPDPSAGLELPAEPPELDDFVEAIAALAHTIE